VKARAPRAAGYSRRTLVEKLGIKPGQRVVLLGAPADFARTLGALPAGTTRACRLSRSCAMIIAFSKNRKALEGGFVRWKRALHKDGALWVCWPKRASGVATDLAESDVRNVGLAGGLVDVKVCAVDGTWSGLRFVYRLKDRA
jgi:hypothetical protein